MKSAAISLPSYASPAFQAHIDNGRAIRWVLLHFFFVVHRAGIHPAKLVQTDHLMNAVLLEVTVLTIVGDFNIGPIWMPPVRLAGMPARGP